MSLIARYKFDGNARDSEGSAHGTAIDVTWAPSQLVDGGGEARLNGATSRIETAIQFSTETAASLPVWFRPREGAGHLVGQHDGTNGLAIEQTETGKIRLVVGATASAEVSVYPGEYHHGVAVYDNGEATLYLDNEAVATVTATVTWPAVPVTIGARTAGSAVLECDVMDMRGYSQPLQSTDIEQLNIEVNLSTLDPEYVSFPHDSMAGHYTMESITGSTLLDELRQNNGTISGATPVNTEIGGALSFDGLNDVVTLPAILPAGNAARSVTLWFKLDTLFSGQCALFGTGDDDPGKSFTLLLNRPDPGCIWFEGWSNDPHTTPILQDNKWYHLALVYDGSTTGQLGQAGIGTGLTVYLDGEAVPWSTYAFGGDLPLNTTLNQVRLGARRIPGDDYANHMPGDIRGARFYTREISGGEVRAIYRRQAPQWPYASIERARTIAPGGMGWHPNATAPRIPNPTVISRSGRSSVQGVTAQLAPPAWFDQRDGSGGSHLSPAGVVSRPDRQGRLSGNATDQNGQPVSRRVRCFERRTGRIVRETWSNAAGYYQFDDLDPGKRFTVVAHDYSGTYNAVIADNAQPEVPA